jgi:hypothetical protein
VSVDDENPIEGDLRLSGGDLVWISGVEEVAQRIRSRLRFFKGEWFLNQREGTPIFQSVLGVRAPSIPYLTTLYRRIIATTPGVREVRSLVITLDSARLMTITFEATTDSGETLTSGDFGPFIVGE